MPARAIVFVMRNKLPCGERRSVVSWRSAAGRGRARTRFRRRPASPPLDRPAARGSAAPRARSRLPLRTERSTGRHVLAAGQLVAPLGSREIVPSTLPVASRRPSGLSDASVGPMPLPLGMGYSRARPVGRPSRSGHNTILSPALTVSISRPLAVKLGLSIVPWWPGNDRTRRPARVLTSSRNPLSPPTTSTPLAGTKPIPRTGPFGTVRSCDTCRSVRASISLTVPSSCPPARSRPSGLAA